MAGTVGFTGGADSDGGTDIVSVGTDSSGAVTVTITPTKPPPDTSGAPDPSQPPTVLKGDGASQTPLPAPGQEAGDFIYKVGDPLFVKIELKTTCEVVLTIATDQGMSNPIYTLTMPSQAKSKKMMLVSLLRQAMIDARPKPPAKSDAPPPLKVAPVKPPPKVLQPDH
jgi:hypothetical protein